MHTISTLHNQNKKLNAQSQKLFALIVLLFLGIQSQISAQTSCPISNEVSISVYPQPTISITGATTICQTGTAQLTATPNGGVPGSCTVQWESSPTGIDGSWTSIPAANANTYTTLALSVTTYYHALLTCSETTCKGAISNMNRINVSPVLSIKTQPVGFDECVGGNQQLSVVVAGADNTNPAYIIQWYSSLDGVNNWIADTRGTGATTANFIPDASRVGSTYYRVSATSTVSGCGTITSDPPVKVSVYDKLVINVSPIGFEQCMGGNQTLTVKTAGGEGPKTPLTYQWYSGADSTSMTPITGATTIPFTPTSTTANTTFYKVVVTSSNTGCGGSIPSFVAKVIVSPQVKTVTDIKDITECQGGKDVLNFVTSGGASDNKFVWESSTTQNGAYFPISTVLNSLPTFTPPSTTSGTTYYRVRTTSALANCSFITSRMATVIINDTLSLTSALPNIEQCVGGNDPLSITFAGGITSSVQYQWQYSADNSTWNDSIGQTAATLTPQSINPGTRYYRVYVYSTGSKCGQLTSNVSIVTVNSQLKIMVQPSDITQCTNGTAPLTPSITGGSSLKPNTYRWQLSANSTSGWTDSPSGNTATYTPNSVSAGVTYYRLIINANNQTACTIDTTRSAKVDVRNPISFKDDLIGFIECKDGNQQLLVNVINGTSNSNAASNLIYTWYSSATLAGAFTVVPGAVGSSFTPVSTNAGTTYYYVQVSDGGSASCGTIPSKKVAVTVNQQLSIVSQPQDLNECTKGDQTLSVVIKDGAGNYGYQWQISQTGNPADFTDIPGEKTNIYKPVNSSASTTYYRVILSATGTGCTSDTSRIAKVIVAPQLSTTKPLAAINECMGGTDKLSLETSGGSGFVHYSWQVSNDGSNYSTAPNDIDNSTYQPASDVAGAKYYRVLISKTDKGCAQDTAFSVLVTIFDKPQLTSLAKVSSVCKDGQVEINATKTGGTGSCVITWQVSADNGATFNNVPTQPTSPDSRYITPPLKANVKYHATITCSGSGCCN